MKRRDFLSLCGLVAGACMIPAPVARLIRESCIRAREPYLVLPRDPSSTLYAMSRDGLTDFTLYVGDPFEEQKTPTWRKYFDEHRSAGALGIDPAHAEPEGRDERERASQYEGIDVDDKEAVEGWWREHVGDLEEDPVSIAAGDEIDGWALENWEHRSAWALGVDGRRPTGRPRRAGCERVNSAGGLRGADGQRLSLFGRSSARRHTSRPASTNSARTSPSRSRHGDTSDCRFP